MLMSLENGTKLFGERIVFTGVTLKLEDGDRVGLVGVNGVGKSTLLNVLEGSLTLDEGERAVKNEMSLGFLRQNSGVDGNNTIYEEMRSVFAPLLAELAQMKRTAALMGQYTDHEDAAYIGLAEEYARLQTHFEANEGYNLDVKIQTILNGMGFAGKDTTTACATLSGGEKTRLALAKLLLKNPEVLMLDEPTNHLDFATLQWLEEYLQGYKGALIVVSHDRYFLDQISTKIWEMERLRFTTYKGNYTKYTQMREMVYDRQLKEYQAQQANIVKLTDYIAKNKTRASTANMAKSREKELDRMEIIKAPPKPIHAARMAFRYEQEPVKDVLHVEDLSLSVGEGESGKVLVSHVDFDLMRGEKIALVGSNGIGKTTFLKTLLGQLKPQEGRIKWGRNVKLAYFEQEQLGLTGYKSVLEELWDRFPQTYERDVRNVLGNLLFTGEAVNKRVDKLSGGERARLKFAIMMYESGNVLLLDEPTNHLDLATKEVLDRALIGYEGTILTVSHDRYLLSRMPTKIVEMLPNGFITYVGGYENYLRQHEIHAEVAIAAPEKAELQENDYHRSKKQRAQEVARKGRLNEVEQEISDIELAIVREQARLSEPEISCDYQAVREICDGLDGMRAALNACMEEWARLSEEE